MVVVSLGLTAYLKHRRKQDSGQKLMAFFLSFLSLSHLKAVMFSC